MEHNSWLASQKLLAKKMLNTLQTFADRKSTKIYYYNVTGK